MHTYIFNTDVGTFEITNMHPTNHHHRTYELWIEDEKLGEYLSAQDAAEDVAAFNTGFAEWDNQSGDGMRVPESIEGWTKVESVACEDAENLDLRDIAESPFLNGEAEN